MNGFLRPSKKEIPKDYDIELQRNHIDLDDEGELQPHLIQPD